MDFNYIIFDIRKIYHAGNSLLFPAGYLTNKIIGINYLLFLFKEFDFFLGTASIPAAHEEASKQISIIVLKSISLFASLLSKNNDITRYDTIRNSADKTLQGKAFFESFAEVNPHTEPATTVDITAAAEMNLSGSLLFPRSNEKAAVATANATMPANVAKIRTNTGLLDNPPEMTFFDVETFFEFIGFCLLTFVFDIKNSPNTT